MHDAHRQLLTLFAELLDAGTAEAQAAYLDQACRGDPDLRARLEALLHAHHEAGGFLAGADATIERPAPRAVVAPREAPGTLIGPYKLLQQIGEGGMGSVFMAEQTQPVQRQVALKIIKPGMDSRQVIVRFEAERQALAVMDHPNIARVLDAGTTESGRPYFVMELVKGVPITRYCDEHRLTPRQRLELFVPICHAVQHAHQKGIIHRDLKPSNVLIAEYDDQPVPKVIDFGIAKATGPKLTDHTLFTEFGQVVGTLEYMSPEQAKLNALDIDTRSDLYALGVLLYELLTGTTPFERARLQQVAFDEILRVIREEEPPRPSTRLSTIDTLPTVAANRGMEPKKLSGLVRGELDWIVMKALEKDRNRRYETANEFALDLLRYLHDEPVQAGPPSASYRLRKFARRNRGPLVASVGVLLVLLVGIVGTTLGWLEAQRQRDAADLARGNEATQRQVAEGQRDRALKAEGEARTSEKKALQQEQEARQAEQQARAVLSFFQDTVLAAARPKEQAGGLGSDVTIRAAVDAAEPQIAEAFREQPLVEARIRGTLDATYHFLGQAKQALQQSERAQALYQATLGPEHPETLTSMNNLASAYRDVGRYEDAVRLFEQTLALSRVRRGPEDGATLLVMANLAGMYLLQGRQRDALELYEQTLKRQQAALGPEHLETVSTMHNLARAYLAVGRQREAVPLFEKTLGLRQAQLGPAHPDTLPTLSSLAVAYQRAGQLHKALPLFDQAWRLYQERLGPAHPATLRMMVSLADAYREAGQLQEAVRLAEQATQRARALQDEKHPDTLTIVSMLATIYRAAGRFHDALPLLEQTLQLKKTVHGPAHPETLSTMHHLAQNYRHLGRLEDARVLFEQTVQGQKKALGPAHPDTLASLQNLASVYQFAGRLHDALPLFEDVFEQYRTTLGPEHPFTLTSMMNLAGAYLQAGRRHDALPLFQKTLQVRQRTRGPEHPETLTAMHNLAAASWMAQQLQRSVPLFEETLRLRTAVLGPDHPETLGTLANLAINYRDAGRLAEAVILFEEMQARTRRRPDGFPAELRWVLRPLADTYDQARHFAKSEPLYRGFLDEARNQYGPEDPRLGVPLEQLSLNLARQKKHAEAELLLRSCLQILERKQPDAWSRFYIQGLLGASLLEQKKYADALPLLEASCVGLKQRQVQIPLSVRRLRLSEALQRLVRLHEAMGNQDEAAKWREELAAMQQAAKQP
jgi:serine/threonine protein kinase/tetratricopeptide (TPR) repeat protein